MDINDYYAARRSVELRIALEEKSKQTKCALFATAWPDAATAAHWMVLCVKLLFSMGLTEFELAHHLPPLGCRTWRELAEALDEEKQGSLAISYWPKGLRINVYYA